MRVAEECYKSAYLDSHVEEIRGFFTAEAWGFHTLSCAAINLLIPHGWVPLYTIESKQRNTDNFVAITEEATGDSCVTRAKQNLYVYFLQCRSCLLACLLPNNEIIIHHSVTFLLLFIGRILLPRAQSWGFMWRFLVTRRWSRLKSYEFHCEGLSNFSPSAETLVQIQHSYSNLCMNSKWYMLLIRCEELRINHLTPLLVIKCPTLVGSCGGLIILTSSDVFIFNLGLRFEGPSRVWRALEISILNIDTHQFQPHAVLLIKRVRSHRWV